MKSFLPFLLFAVLFLNACSFEGSNITAYTSAVLPDEIAIAGAVPAVSIKKTKTKSNDEIIAELFENEESDVQVAGEGTVTKLLKDDNDGSRHQRFILELESGQTLLIAHNIDIAPRLESLEEGDTVEFYGEYYYSEQGGGIHWTHHDPDGEHIDGWLKYKEETFE